MLGLYTSADKPSVTTVYPVSAAGGAAGGGAHGGSMQLHDAAHVTIQASWE